MRFIPSITQHKNFCRVFRSPNIKHGLCFSRDNAVTFQMVDWFNPLPPIRVKATLEMDIHKMYELCSSIIKFVHTKSYARTGDHFLVLTEFGEAWQFRIERTS